MISQQIARAITEGATAQSLECLHESWHADIKEAVRNIDTLFSRVRSRFDGMYWHVLMLNNRDGEVFIQHLGSYESTAGEFNGTHERLAEYDADLKRFLIRGERASLPRSRAEFRAYFAEDIAECMAKMEAQDEVPAAAPAM